MSTIRVDNFGPSAGGTTYSARGIAKAWINFDGTGTVAIKDSLNTSSITDVGVGQYSQNYSTAFSAADYTVAHGAAYVSGNGFFHYYFAKSATLVGLQFIATGGAFADSADISGIQHGDLA